MNLEKIGKFISERRKAEGLTQASLAQHLGVSDRAVSKWERAKSLPDVSIMLDLCEILKITVNDLLSGEVVSVENYNKELENKLIKMIKQKEQNDKRLLTMEIVVGIICVIPLIISAIIASIVPMEEWLASTIVLLCLLPLLTVTPFMLKIEQTAGYYVCEHCGHKYVPKYKSVFLAMHMGRTRYMKCPECHRRSWQKKVVKKDS